MNTNPFPYEKDNKERIPFEHYMARFAQLDPQEAAGRCALPYNPQTQEFTLRLMGRTYAVRWPEFTFRCTDADPSGYLALESYFPSRILMARYLLEGRCVPPSGKFVTYRDVPWGEVYFRNFQGRCLARLAFGFGGKLDAFCKGMERLGASPVPSGDAAYQFEFLDNLFVRFILWAGDEEFPPSSQILFSDNFPQAFTAEDMAVVGDIAIGTLKELAK